MLDNSDKARKIIEDNQYGISYYIGLYSIAALNSPHSTLDTQRKNFSKKIASHYTKDKSIHAIISQSLESLFSRYDFSGYTDQLREASVGWVLQISQITRLDLIQSTKRLKIFLDNIINGDSPLDSLKKHLSTPVKVKAPTGIYAAADDTTGRYEREAAEIFKNDPFYLNIALRLLSINKRSANSVNFRFKLLKFLSGAILSAVLLYNFFPTSFSLSPALSNFIVDGIFTTLLASIIIIPIVIFAVSRSTKISLLSNTLATSIGSLYKIEIAPINEPQNNPEPSNTLQPRFKINLKNAPTRTPEEEQEHKSYLTALTTSWFPTKNTTSHPKQSKSMPEEEKPRASPTKMEVLSNNEIIVTDEKIIRKTKNLTLILPTKVLNEISNDQERSSFEKAFKEGPIVEKSNKTRNIIKYMENLGIYAIKPAINTNMRITGAITEDKTVVFKSYEKGPKK